MVVIGGGRDRPGLRLARGRARPVACSSLERDERGRRRPRAWPPGCSRPSPRPSSARTPLLRLNLASRERCGPASPPSSRSAAACRRTTPRAGALVVAADRDDAERAAPPARPSSGRSGSTPSGSAARVPRGSSRACRRASPAAILAPHDAPGRAARGGGGAARGVRASRRRAGRAAPRSRRRAGRRRVTGVTTGRARSSRRGTWSWPPGPGAARSTGGSGPPVRPVKGQMIELRARRAQPARSSGSSARRAATSCPRGDDGSWSARPSRSSGFDTTRHRRRRLPPARGGAGGAARRRRAGVRGGARAAAPRHARQRPR